MTRMDEIKARLSAKLRSNRHEIMDYDTDVEAQSAWIKNAPDDIAYLLAECERLTAERDALRAALQRAIDQLGFCANVFYENGSKSIYFEIIKSSKDYRAALRQAQGEEREG